jgi:DNA processing protein
LKFENYTYICKYISHNKILHAMTQEDLLYTLALTQVEGVGDILSKKLLTHCGSAKGVFTSKKNKLISIDGIGEYLYKNLQNKNVFYKAEQELLFIEKQGIETLFYESARYPKHLKNCIDAPIILFRTGNVNLDEKKLISIVGTRKITTSGADFIQKLIKELIPLDPVIVSGFAYGVDIQAHQEALKNNLQTIGVLAHGLNQIYPKDHKKYVAKMEENGGFLTEFWSTSNPDRENFVRRNRIVAGMTEATIVVESAEKGGSLITAQIANDYNKDVFAVPGRITDKYSVGCNNLIKTQRAHMITSAADLVYILNWDISNKKQTKLIQKQLFINLEPEEQQVYDFLQTNGKELIDIIALQTSLPIYKMSSILLNMELKGVIKPLPGKYFEVV